MYRIKKGRIWIANVEHYHSQWIGSTAIVNGHSQPGWHDDRFTGFRRLRLTSLYFQSKHAFHDIDRNRKSMGMKERSILGAEVRCENAHLLVFALRHSLDGLT